MSKFNCPICNQKIEFEIDELKNHIKENHISKETKDSKKSWWNERGYSSLKEAVETRKNSSKKLIDYSKPPRYKLKDLKRMKTISRGQYDNLKLNTGVFEVWLSRMTIEDGMPYNNQVYVIRVKDGKTVDKYEAK